MCADPDSIQRAVIAVFAMILTFFNAAFNTFIRCFHDLHPFTASLRQSYHSRKDDFYTVKKRFFRTDALYNVRISDFWVRTPEIKTFFITFL